MEARAISASATTRRRVLGAFGLALLAWVPLILLTLAFPRTGPEPTITFLEDLSVHVRFLLVVPLLVLAEAVIVHRSTMALAAVRTSGLISEGQRARFDDGARRMARLADSAVAQALLAGVVTAVIGFAIRTHASADGPRWFESQEAAGTHLSAAGWWYVVASVMLAFLQLRLVWRYLLWCWLLYRMSELDLRLVGSHPDRAGGLGFLNVGHAAFSAIPLAASFVVSSRVATEVLQAGVPLQTFQLPLISFVVLSLAMGMLPLPIFARALARTKRTNLMEYGKLATGYVQDFERKWMKGGAPQGEALLGSGDIQSLADIGGSFERLVQMKITPLDRRTVIAFAMASVLPLLPLVLTVMPLEEIVKVLVRAIV